MNRGKISLLLLFLLVLAIPAVAEVVLESNTGSAYVAINTSNNERMRVTSNGRFGFNTTNPTTAFDIGGGVYNHLYDVGTDNSLGVAGNMEVLGYLYSNVVIGTYSVQSNNDPAFEVTNASGYQMFGVNTIDGSTEIHGNTWDIADNDLHNELQVTDDAYISDDLRVGDVLAVATDGFENYTQQDFSIIGNNSMGYKQPRALIGADAVKDSGDLYIDGSLAVGDMLFANTIIGTSSIDTDSHEAFMVRNYSASNTFFNVDTIDHQVTISGFNAHNTDTDNYAELLVNDDAQVDDDLRVGDRVSIGTTTRYDYNRIGPGADPASGTRIGDHIISGDFNTNADTIMMGNLGVVGDLYADAIIGASTIDATDHNAFVVSPYNDIANWVLNVDTIDNEVNVSGNLTVRDNLQVGFMDGNRYNYSRFGNLREPTESVISDNNDVFIAGDTEIGGHLYANVVIGTYSVQSNNDPAFEVMNDSAYQIFGVNTIDGSVEVHGNTWDIADSDTHNELQVTDDAYISDDLIVGDVFNVGNGETTNRYNYNRIGDVADNPEQAEISSSDDLYVKGDVEIDGKLYANAVIGTYTIQSDEHDAFRVENASGDLSFKVDTIDNEVNVTGDLNVGDTFKAGDTSSTRYNYNRIGTGGTATIPDGNSDLFIADELEVDGNVRLDGSTIDINSANVDIDGAAHIDNVDFNGNTITTSTGVLTLDSNSDNLDINTGTIDLSTKTVDVTLKNAVDALNIDSNTLSIDAANNRIGINDASPDYRLEAVGTTGNGYFGLTNSADGDILEVDSSGNVGINDSSPDAKLDVAGTVLIGGTEGQQLAIDTSGHISDANDPVTIQDQLLVDDTSAEALLIRKNSDAGDIFSVDTSGNKINFGTGYAGTGATMTTAGALSMDSNLIVGGTFTQTGPGSFSTGTGAVSFNGATSVTGSNTFTTGTGQVTFGGNVNANAGVDVSGATTIAGTLTQTGSGHQVTFAGNVDANNGLDVTGNDLTIGGGYGGTGATIYNANGNAKFDGALTVDGTSTLAGTVSVGGGYGSGTGLSLYDNGDLKMNGDLYVDGDTYKVNNLQYNGSLYVEEVARIGVGPTGADTDYLQITDDGVISDADDPVTINDGLNQIGSGQVDFSGNVDANNGLDVTGALTVSTTSTLTGSVTANGGITADGGVFSVADNSGNVHTSGTLDVDLNSSFGGVVSIDDVTDSTSTITGSIHTNGGLGVAENVYVGQDLKVAGDNIDSVGSPLRINDVANQATYIGSGTATTANGDNDFYVTADIENDGNTYLGDELTDTVTVAGDLTVNDYTTLNGNVDINDNIDAAGTTAAFDYSTVDINSPNVDIDGVTHIDQINVNGNNISTNSAQLTLDAANDNLDINTGTIDLSTQPVHVILDGGSLDSLNIDSDTLVIDASNNHVGIGTASPVADLDIGGGSLVKDVDGQDDLVVLDDVVIGGNVYIAGKVNISGGLNISNLNATGDLDMNNNRILNIGNAGTDFDSSGGLTLAGKLVVNDTTDSLSGSTGSIQTDGGLGLAKDLYVGNDVTIAGNTLTFGNGADITNTDASTLTLTESNFNFVGKVNAKSGLDVSGGDLNLGSNYNFAQTGSGTFSTGTGAVSLNGATSVTGSNTFTTGTGQVTHNGNVDAKKGLDVSGGDLNLGSDYNFAQTGSGTFSTGTGAVSLNGATSVTGSNTFTTGTGQVTFGGNVNANAGVDVTGGDLKIGGGYGGTGATIYNANGNAKFDGALTVDGTSTLTSTVYPNGGINADSGKFTVADNSGNVHTDGTLDVSSTSNLHNTLTLSKASGTGLIVSSTDANVAADIAGGVDMEGALEVGNTGGFNVDTAGNIIDVGTYDGDGSMSIGSGTQFSADGALTIVSGGTSDLTLNPAGGQVILADTDTINIGGVSNLAYNAISDSGATSHSLSSDNDLYVEGNLEVDSAAYLDGTVNVGGTINANEINIGGGYGSTGLTINSSGDLLTNGDLYYVNTLATNGSLSVANILTVNDYAKILGGLHVGGTSDPGTDNLIVEGTSSLVGTTTISGILTANGAVNLGNGGDNININAGTGTFQLSSSALGISTAGAVSGVTTLGTSAAATLASNGAASSFGGDLTLGGDLRINGNDLTDSAGDTFFETSGYATSKTVSGITSNGTITYADIGGLDHNDLIFTLDNAFDDGKLIDGANSYINAVKIGDVDDKVYLAAVNNIPTIYGQGAYLRIGDAGTTSHAFNSEDDLLVSGKLESNGAVYADSTLTVASTFTSKGAVNLGDGNDNININAGSGTFQLSSSALDITNTGVITGASIDASQLTGTVSTDRYSAYSDLSTEGYLNPSAAGDIILYDASLNVPDNTVDSGSVEANTLDFVDFQNTMDLDAPLTLNTGSYDINVDSNTLFVDGSANNVGIGTTATSNEKLTVAGNASITTAIKVGTGSPSAVDMTGGDVYIADDLEVDGRYYAKFADLAEIYPSKYNLESGDVVIADYKNDNHIKKSEEKYDTRVLGIVSSKPSMVLNSEEEGYEMALAGKVPVKVSDENGKIMPGDLLTTSSTPGYAMKCNNINKCRGSLVGKALESHSKGLGKINAVVMLG